MQNFSFMSLSTRLWASTERRCSGMPARPEAAGFRSSTRLVWRSFSWKSPHACTEGLPIKANETEKEEGSTARNYRIGINHRRHRHHESRLMMQTSKSKRELFLSGELDYVSHL
jgi:hypothetical protein